MKTYKPDIMTVLVVVVFVGILTTMLATNTESDYAVEAKIESPVLETNEAVKPAFVRVIRDSEKKGLETEI